MINKNLHTFAGIRNLLNVNIVTKLMKLISIKSVSVPAIALSVMSIAACVNIKKAANNYEESAQYETSPKVLELHGDSVEYEVTVTVPAKKLNKKAEVKVEPVVKYGDEANSRPPFSVKGEKAGGKAKKGAVSYSEGGTVTYTDKFAYTDDMKNSKLIAKNTFIIKGEERELNQCVDLKDVTLADGVITTSRMVKSNEDVLLSVDEYVPVDKTQSIEVFYLINRSNFNPNFRDRNAEINNKEQIESLSSLLKDPSFEIKGLTFNSYASPDGEVALNEDLSSDRSDATVKWFKQYLKRYGRYEMFDSNFKAANHFTEDWKGWKAMVQASDLSDKDGILSIMNNSNISDDEKEARIKAQHAASYEKMKVYMLPKLRRTSIVFTAKGGLKNNDELVASSSSLDELSQSELLQLGKITDAPKERKRIFSYYVGKYPKDWRGFNNLAVANLQLGETEDALKNLKTADGLDANNAFVLNNMGVAYKMQSQYNDAEEKYRSAKSKNNSNVNPDYNLGVLYTRMGKYDKALESFNKTNCSYNVGLAYLLKGKYDDAQKTFDCIPAEQKDGSTYYLMAVTSARKGKLDGVTTNLTRAFQKDGDLKARAKDDMEFREFKGKAEFESLFR